jgi:hypothetical protein
MDEVDEVTDLELKRTVAGRRFEEVDGAPSRHPTGPYEIVRPRCGGMGR